MNQENSKCRPTSGPVVVKKIGPIRRSMAESATGERLAVSFGDFDESVEEANIKLFASALNSATTCYSLGYDGVKCVEGVREMVKALEAQLTIAYSFDPTSNNAKRLEELFANLK